MTEDDTVSRPRPTLGVVGLIAALVAYLCGMGGVFAAYVLSETLDVLSPTATQWLLGPSALIGVLGTGIALDVAAVGFWRRLAHRTHRVLLSLALGGVGLVGVLLAIIAIVLVARDMPPTALVILPFMAFVGLMFSLAPSLLFGPVLLIVSLIAKEPGAPAPPVSMPPARPSPAEPAKPGIVCPSCGAENPPDYAFCDRCGAKL